MSNEGSGYDKFIDNLKKKLKLKVLSIYVVNDEEKNEMIDLIYQTQDLDLLYEVDKKIDEILKKVGEITVTLLEKADSNVLIELKMIIQNEVIEKIQQKEEDEDLDLDALEINLDKLIDVI